MRLLVRADFSMCVHAFHAVSLLFTQTTAWWKASSSHSILLGLAADLCVAFTRLMLMRFTQKHFMPTDTTLLFVAMGRPF